MEAVKEHPKIVIKKSTSLQESDKTPSQRLHESFVFNERLKESNNRRSDEHDHIKCPKPTIYFRDGIRSVDFMLVWDSMEESAVTIEGYERRKVFESNLIKEGLELEYELPEKNGLNFIKVSFVGF